MSDKPSPNMPAEGGHHPEDEDSFSRRSRLSRLIFENTPIGLFLFDQQGIMRDCNDYFANLLGMSRKDLGAYDLLKRLASEGAQNAVRDALAGRSGFYEGSFSIAHAQRRPQVKLLLRQLTDEEGRVVGGVGIVEDVTVARTQEETMRQAADRVRRQNRAMVELAAYRFAAGSDVAATRTKILEVASSVLDVARVSIWFFDEHKTAIRCENLQHHDGDAFGEGTILKLEHYPRYFEALMSERSIAADDAQSDPRTSEFTEGYLKPIGITSMLDVPVHRDGETVGIVCFEHVGPKRSWTADEQAFAGSVGDLVSASMEALRLKEAETALEETEEKYRLLVDNANEAIIVAQDGIIRYANPVAATMLQCREGELDGAAFADYVHLDEHSLRTAGKMQRQASSHVGAVHSIKRTDREGFERWIELSAIDFVWEGRPATLNFLNDITERTQIERMVRASEEKYRGLFDSSRDGLAYCDPDGKMLDVNRAFRELLGFSRSELVGIDLLQITPEKWQAQDESIRLGKLLSEGDTGQYEKEFLRKDGSSVPVSVRVWLVRDARGTPVGQWVFVRDMTEELNVRSEIKRRMLEIEKLNKFMIGREMRIIEMKKEVNDLLKHAGQPPRYKI